MTTSFNKFITGALIMCSLNVANANIYDPHNIYLTKTLPSQSEIANPSDATAINVEKLYFQRVVGDVYGNSNLSSASRMTLKNWKTQNGFDVALDLSTASQDALANIGTRFPTDEDRARLVGNSYFDGVDTELKRISADYFNSADLGLGRRMTCIKQTTDLSDAELNLPANQLKKTLNARGKGALACFVSNYGAIGGNALDGYTSFPTTEQATQSSQPQAFATVAMEFWPNKTTDKVRFFVFAESGNPGVDDDKLVYTNGNTYSAIKLDNGTGHSQPGICMSCHGGKINTTNGTTTNSHFLPFDISSLEFAENNGRTGSGDTAAIRKKASLAFNIMNTWIYKAEAAGYSKNTQIGLYLNGSYNNKFIKTNGSIPADSDLFDEFAFNRLSMSDTYVEPNITSQEDKNIYKSIIAPYCRGCHIAQDSVSTATAFLLKNNACTSKDTKDNMPHAEVNDRNFLRHLSLIKPVFGSDCNNVSSLIDFEFEQRSASDSYQTPFLSATSGLNFVISTTSVKNKLTKNVTKRTLQLATNQLNGSITVKNESAPTNAPDTLSNLAFQYLINSTNTNNFIEVVFKSKTSATLRTIKILNTTYEITESNNTKRILNNDDVRIIGLNIDSNNVDQKLFRVAKLKDQIPAGTRYAFINLKRASTTTPLEMDDMLVNFDESTEIISVVDFEHGDSQTSGFGSVTDGAANRNCKQRGGLLATQDRKVARDAGRYSIGIPATKECSLNRFFSGINLRDVAPYLGPNKVDPNGEYTLAFDYSADSTAQLRVLVGNTHIILNTASATGVAGTIKSGRFVYSVPKSVITSGELRIDLDYIPKNNVDAGVALDNFVVYKKK